MREYARLPRRPSISEIPDAERAEYESVIERTLRLAYERYDTPARYFDALLNSPPLAAALVRLGTLVRQGQVRGMYSDAQRELIDVVYSNDFDYNGFLTVHLPDAFAVGVRPEAIKAIRTGDEVDLTEEEAVLVAYCRQVATGGVTDESYRGLCERWGTRWAVEFTICCAFIFMTLRLWQALGVANPDNTEIDQLFHELLHGSTPIPHPSERIG